MNQNSGNVLFRPEQPEYPAITPTIANNLNQTLTSPPKTSPSKRAALPEEIPMLNSGNATAGDSDTESPPAAAAPPKPTPRASPVKYSDLNYRNALAKDNYVNVPSTIINMDQRQGNNDAVSNPAYVVLGGTNETRT